MEDPDRAATRAIFESIHFRFGGQWLELLAELERVEKKKQAFEANLFDLQKLIDEEMFGNGAAGSGVEGGTEEKKPEELVQPARKQSLIEKLSSPLLFSSHRLYHSLGTELQALKKQYADREKEKASLVEDAKLILFHFSCQRYLGRVGIKPTDIKSEGTFGISLHLQNVYVGSLVGKELEAVLQKFALESGLTVPNVYDSCFGEVRELLFHLKRAGDLYQQLYLNAKTIKASIEEVDTKWLALNDVMSATSNNNKNAGMFPLLKREGRGVGNWGGPIIITF